MITVLLGSAPAQAMQLSPLQKSEMKLHYDKATRAYDVGKYQEAIEEYQKAYEIGGDAAMIYNIAQAYRLSDQLSEAIRFYRRYLQRSPNAPNREIVERRIAELERVVDERKKSGVPLVPVAPMPTPAPTPPIGTLPPPTPPPAVIPPPTTPPPGSLGGPPVVPFEPAAHAGGSRARYVVGIGLMGLGAVAGGLAIWQGKVAQEKADKLSSQSQQKGSIVFNPAIEDNGKNANRFAILLGSVSGACLIAGGIVLLTAPSSSSSSAEAPPRIPVAVSPVIGLGLVGAEAAWSF